MTLPPCPAHGTHPAACIAMHHPEVAAAPPAAMVAARPLCPGSGLPGGQFTFADGRRSTTCQVCGRELADGPGGVTPNHPSPARSQP